MITDVNLHLTRIIAIIILLEMTLQETKWLFTLLLLRNPVQKSLQIQ